MSGIVRVYDYSSACKPSLHKLYGRVVRHGWSAKGYLDGMGNDWGLATQRYSHSLHSQMKNSILIYGVTLSGKGASGDSSEPPGCSIYLTAHAGNRAGVYLHGKPKGVYITENQPYSIYREGATFKIDLYSMLSYFITAQCPKKTYWGLYAMKMNLK